MELTISYDNHLYSSGFLDETDAKYKAGRNTEDKKQDGCGVFDKIGGSFDVAECKCNFPYCCGDLARRYMSNTLRDEDYFLLYVKDEQAMIYMRRVGRLNVKYCEYLASQGDYDLQVRSPISDIQRKLFILEVYNTAVERGNASKTKFALQKLWLETNYVAYCDKLVAAK